MGLAKGWDKESADLYIHETGARISRTAYRGKMAWWFFPVSLDVPAVEHAATDEGREQAFATSEKELPKFRAKPKKKAVIAKKKKAAADEEGERGPGGAAAEANADQDADEEDGEDTD